MTSFLKPLPILQSMIKRGIKVSQIAYKGSDPHRKPVNPFAVHAAPGSHRIYKILALMVGIPVIVGHTIAAVFHKDEKERPPFVPYKHMRIRHKRFPWGDGEKSFFHNPRKNALPSGYETEE